MSFYKETANLGVAQSMDVGRLYTSATMLDEAEKWIRKAVDKECEPAKNESIIKGRKNYHLSDLFFINVCTM